jgi:hypothetical protein
VEGESLLPVFGRYHS